MWRQGRPGTRWPEPGDATLVDVRTRAEWTYVGVPELGTIGKQLVLVEWDEFPSGQAVPDFAGRLKSALDRGASAPAAPLYFICRSGARSRKAAIAATAAGYAHLLQRRGRFRRQAGPGPASRDGGKLEGGGAAMGSIIGGRALEAEMGDFRPARSVRADGEGRGPGASIDAGTAGGRQEGGLMADPVQIPVRGSA